MTMSSPHAPRSTVWSHKDRTWSDICRMAMLRGFHARRPDSFPSCEYPWNRVIVEHDPCNRSFDMFCYASAIYMSIDVMHCDSRFSAAWHTLYNKAMLLNSFFSTNLENHVCAPRRGNSEDLESLSRKRLPRAENPVMSGSPCAKRGHNVRRLLPFAKLWVRESICQGSTRVGSHPTTSVARRSIPTLHNRHHGRKRRCKETQPVQVLGHVQPGPPGGPSIHHAPR